MASVPRSISMVASALTLFSACLTPPPIDPNAPKAQAEPVETGEPSAGAKPGGDTLLVWDGDETGTGAKGWQDCDKKPDCKVTLAPEPGIGFNNSIGLKFHGEGPGWIGGGWNLFGWFPENAGYDITPYKKLVFRLKLSAKTPEEAPDLTALAVLLKCSSNPKKSESNAAPFSKVTTENLLDGQWHEITVPLVDLKKEGFDPKTTWEFSLTNWSATPRNFTAIFDDIRFVK